MTMANTVAASTTANTEMWRRPSACVLLLIRVRRLSRLLQFGVCAADAARERPRTTRTAPLPAPAVRRKPARENRRFPLRIQGREPGRRRGRQTPPESRASAPPSKCAGRRIPAQDRTPAGAKSRRRSPRSAQVRLDAVSAQSPRTLQRKQRVRRRREQNQSSIAPASVPVACQSVLSRNPARLILRVS